MFLVSHEAAVAIQAAYLSSGEEGAVIELRRFYPIDNDAAALNAVRAIASWKIPDELPSIRHLSSKRERKSGVT